MVKKAKISEIFDSVQGEGIYQGIRQLFVRFYGCNLDCKFCDTKLTEYEKYSSLELFNRLQEFKGNYHSVCFTGGEPLLEKGFLKEIIRLLKNNGTKIYLETNATLPENLEEIIDDIDIIALDFKLPSSTRLSNFWQEHERFLKTALKKDCFVKTVICLSTKEGDLAKAVDLFSGLNKNIPFILQPNHFELGAVLTKKMRKFQEFCLDYLPDVRIVPQMHKSLKIR